MVPSPHPQSPQPPSPHLPSLPKLPHVLTLLMFPFPVLPVNAVMPRLKLIPLSFMEVTTVTLVLTTDLLMATAMVWELMVMLVWEDTTVDTTVSILPTTDFATTLRENKFPVNYV